MKVDATSVDWLTGTDVSQAVVLANMLLRPTAVKFTVGEQLLHLKSFSLSVI